MSLTHPNVLIRAVRALQEAAPDWNGGVLTASSPVSHRAALRGDSAVLMLTMARDHLRGLYAPTRSRDVAGLVWHLKSDWKNHRRQARVGIRGAAREIAAAQPADERRAA